MRYGLKTAFAAALALSAGSAISGTASAQEEQTLLLRAPALSQDHLAFVYAGDIWVANRDGSDPRRLTSHPAEERNPKFSPDGSMIAFTGTYDSNADVYVIAVEGGQPERLTWHPYTDEVNGWSHDGTKVAFTSRREVDFGRSNQLYHVSVDGGLPDKIMDAPLFRGAWSDDGRRLAYMRFGPAYNGLYGGSSGWRGYRGGTTPSITIMNMGNQRVTDIPGERINDINPMWVGGDVYFLSDREDKTLNVYRYDTDDQSITRLTNETVWDIRAADAHGGTIVYEAGGRLKALDLESGTVEEIAVSIKPDLPQRRPQWKDASSTIQALDLSPTAKRVLITARGDVFTVPVEDGSTRNLTATDGVREADALWSPKGDEIAFISDATGQHKLIITDQTGTELRSFDLGPDYYYLNAWGGEGQRIIFESNHLELFAIDAASGDITEIATGARREQVEVAVSPDGRWLAYTEEKPNHLRDLMLFNFESGTATRVSDGMSDVGSPAFSRDGAYLYFAASTNSGPLQVGLDMSSQERPYRAGLYAVVLAADGKSPLLPKPGDEEAADEEEGESEASDEEADEAGDEEETETRIDLDGISERIVALPVAERNYDSLDVAKDGALYYIQRVQPGITREPPGETSQSENALVRFDFEEKSAQTLISGVSGFGIGADGEHLIVALIGNQILTGKAGDSFDGEPVNTRDVRSFIDPANEWAHIFDETWRMQRDFFYDPGLHGIDWQAIYDRYRPLVDHVGRREDLNTLLVEMIGELHVGHNRIGGGDTHDEPSVGIGLLGADLRIENGRYRVKRVYTGENWNPFLEGPLAAPGIGVEEGDYILAVNGRDLTETDNIFAHLANTVGEQVTLSVNGRPRTQGARDVVVEPVSNEFMLRRWAWIEENRNYVDEKTGGRVGYVYLPNTGGDGYRFFNRMYFAQGDREAMIIDERTNGGGQAANYITDVLSWTHLSGWKDRDGLVFNTPGGVTHGPKVMLIDQGAGSGGDFLPYAFRYKGIGKLIGKRTWGGLIGISANPFLIDGGFLVVPFFRFFTPEGEWTIENEGVAPDIEVDLDPAAFNRGEDTQLDRAIAEVLSDLEGFTPPDLKEAPAYPTELGQ